MAFTCRRFWTRSLVALCGAVALLAVGAWPAASGASGDATTFLVRIGGSSTDGAVQTMDFYPGVVTIHAGDTVRWVMNASEPHTVLFPDGAILPPASPPTLQPSGGSTFTGSGVFSSGLLFPGQSYSLTFPTPGIYVYQCGIHPDMEGVVVVLPTGAMLPFTPSQAFTQGQAELQADLNAGLAAQAASRLTTTPGPHGTTVYHVNADVASQPSWTVPVASPSDPAVRGFATLALTGSATISIRLDLSGLAPGAAYTADLQAGTADPGGPVVAALGGFTADASGGGGSTTALSGLGGIPGNVWFLAVRDASGALAASGEIAYPEDGVMRFLPETLTIHAGDTVVWTQTDPHEIHTVTFLAPGQKAPDFPGQVAATPAGGPTVTGPGFYNSGILGPGQSYTLTFTKPGTYAYQCLIHDAIGMTGAVVVLPAPPGPSGRIYIVRPGDTLWSIARRLLGNAFRWPEIYRANERTVGGNPGLIRVGESLVIL